MSDKIEDNIGAHTCIHSTGEREQGEMDGLCCICQDQRIKQLEKNRYEQVWHRCKTGIIRPYPPLLCSTCLPSDKVEVFNPLKRIEQLEKAIKQIKKKIGDCLWNKAIEEIKDIIQALNEPQATNDEERTDG